MTQTHTKRDFQQQDIKEDIKGCNNCLMFSSSSLVNVTWEKWLKTAQTNNKHTGELQSKETICSTILEGSFIIIILFTKMWWAAQTVSYNVRHTMVQNSMPCSAKIKDQHWPDGGAIVLAFTVLSCISSPRLRINFSLIPSILTNSARLHQLISTMKLLLLLFLLISKTYFCELVLEILIDFNKPGVSLFSRVPQ